MHNLRLAIRLLFKSPGFTLVTTLMLALGIGATTIVFSWTRTVLLRPFPGVEDPGRLVVLCTTYAGRISDTVSYPHIQDLQGLTNVFAGVIGSQITPACLRIDGQLEWAYGQMVTSDYFPVLGIRPQLGRFFVTAEDQAIGGAPYLILSHNYWSRRFANDPNVIGRTLELNRHPFTIVGVAPEGFLGTMSGLNLDFWTPIVMHREVAGFGNLTARGDSWLHVIGRLQPGLNLRHVQTAVDTLNRQLQLAYPDSHRDTGIRVLPPHRSPWGGQAYFLPVLSALTAVSFGVLLIVIANIANLLLARAVGRQKEIAIRLAIGAGRTHLLRQLLTESLTLGILGGLAGAAVAWWGTDLFRLFMPSSYLPIEYPFGLDSTTLLFTLALTIATGLLFGLAPAWQCLKTNLNAQLKEGGRTSADTAPHLRLRNLLVSSEIALALLLLICAALCLKGFREAQQVSLGFNPDRLLLAGLRLAAHGHNESTGKVFYRQLHDRIQALPGVESAALSSWFPLGFEGGSGTGAVPEGYQVTPGEDIGASYAIISPGYFHTMGTPILEGRDFTDRDDADSENVVIINETLAHRFWPDGSPVGRKLVLFGGRTATVVGLVPTGKYRSLNEPPKAFVWVPYHQGAWDLNLGIVLRTTGEPTAYARLVRDTVRSVDGRVEVWSLIGYADFIEAAFIAQRIASTLLAVLGATALILASLGVYGLMAYVVGQRTHELGIRMALGAGLREVVLLILGAGLKLTAAGLFFGVLGALLVTRLLGGLLFGVSPFDPWVFLAALLLLAVVSATACAIPAFRAALISPMQALREP